MPKPGLRKRPQTPKSALAKSAPRQIRPPQSEAEKWLGILPPPPHPSQELIDDGVVEIWMRRCAEAGGLQGLAWAWQPDNFPYGPTIRGRMFHVYGQLRREFEENFQYEAEQVAREQQARARDQRDELMRQKGWR